MNQVTDNIQQKEASASTAVGKKSVCTCKLDLDNLHLSCPGQIINFRVLSISNDGAIDWGKIEFLEID
jgi:hypothetical protein